MFTNKVLLYGVLNFLFFKCYPKFKIIFYIFGSQHEQITNFFIEILIKKCLETILIKMRIECSSFCLLYKYSSVLLKTFDTKNIFSSPKGFCPTKNHESLIFKLIFFLLTSNLLIYRFLHKERVNLYCSPINIPITLEKHLTHNKNQRTMQKNLTATIMKMG